MTTTYKTVNRGSLLKKAKAGKLLVKCSYHYTDDYLRDFQNNYGEMDEFMPVMITEYWGHRVKGYYMMDESEFKSQVGRAYKRVKDGVEEEEIVLSVHSNLSYRIKIIK